MGRNGHHIGQPWLDRVLSTDSDLICRRNSRCCLNTTHHSCLSDNGDHHQGENMTSSQETQMADETTQMNETYDTVAVAFNAASSAAAAREAAESIARNRK
jgi:hypothetical protein